MFFIAKAQLRRKLLHAPQLILTLQHDSVVMRSARRRIFRSAGVPFFIRVCAQAVDIIIVHEEPRVYKICRLPALRVRRRECVVYGIER